MEGGARRLSPEEYLLAILLGLMVALNFVGILSRYWLHLSLPWIEEVEVGLFVWTVFLGAGLTVTRDIHLGFSALVDRFPVSAQRVIAVVARIAFVGFFAILGWFGLRMVLGEIANNQRTPVLGWPEWLIGSAIPIGMALALIRIITLLVRRPSA
jgi:TRAP-type C4-dicarboxylate transport system permease small subunit